MVSCRSSARPGFLGIAPEFVPADAIVIGLEQREAGLPKDLARSSGSRRRMEKRSQVNYDPRHRLAVETDR